MLCEKSKTKKQSLKNVFVCERETDEKRKKYIFIY